ncbi:hypothetical protein PVAND_017145 [Polypedilum vanderplanki]|uniref:Uncharacterized protein n=1 Tax=Polypedilum vanderplanki TaxID=319348 RepID=A0A9J6BHG7_POLVA|nr:hypothetical protein PVAND_017145 [Polypedilum vanderplanki]
MTQMMLDAMGISTGCPVARNKTIGCDNKERLVKTFSLMNQNSVRTLLGGDPEDIRLPINIEHDTGKTCLEIIISYSGIPKRG